MMMKVHTRGGGLGRLMGALGLLGLVCYFGYCVEVADPAIRRERAAIINAQDEADAAKIKIDQERKFNARILKIKKSHNLVDCTQKAFLTDKIITWNEITDVMKVSTLGEVLDKKPGVWVLRYCD